jgi:hypothetical protein
VEGATDAMSAEPSSTNNEPDADPVEASDAPPAEPESHVPAENEADPNAKEVNQEHGP